MGSSHGAAESSLSPMQPHLPVWDGLYLFHCHGSGRCLQLGKVMGVLYPGPVSRHNLVSPLLSLLYRVPVWIMDTVVGVVPLVDARPPRTSPMGIELEWLGKCHGNGMISLECRWSTRMGVRGHGFHGVGPVRYLCRVYLIYR